MQQARAPRGAVGQPARDPDDRIAERYGRDALFAGRAHLADRLEIHMSAPLPLIGVGEPVSAAMTALEKADAAVVLDDGRPTGVITRQDLLAFFES